MQRKNDAADHQRNVDNLGPQVELLDLSGNALEEELDVTNICQRLTGMWFRMTECSSSRASSTFGFRYLSARQAREQASKQ
jgi:hypothetical protein